MTALANALTTAISEPTVSVCPHGWTGVDAIFFRDALIKEGNLTLLLVAGWWNCIEIKKKTISQIKLLIEKKFRELPAPGQNFIIQNMDSDGLIWNYALPSKWRH